MPDDQQSAEQIPPAGARQRRSIACLTADAIDTIPTALESTQYIWLDVAGATDVQIEQAGTALGLHPLTIEDLQEFGQRPKVEDYGDYMYVVAYGGARPPDEDRVTEVHIVFAPDFMATFASEHTQVLEQLVGHAGERPYSRQELLHSLLDVLVDSYAPLLDHFDAEIEQVEELLIQRKLRGRELDIHNLRRELSRVDRIVHRQLEAFTGIRETLRRMPGHHVEDFPYFRDLQDHLSHVADSADAMRERISGLFELYMAALDNRQNVIMRQFTVIAGIFLPLSVITGFFGMNFAWMVQAVDSSAAFAVLGIGVPLLVLVVLVGVFARRGLFRE